ncbi:PEP-utilizing enzyme [Nocardioides sp. CCNWLW239]|uniref:PEP-utilizing enzyme n=1 Tax=Nocardioides sp. CCNWLW239 TaxID=3128902 RepID=UPI00301B247F
MRVLITGVSGLGGRDLARLLLAGGCEVVGTDSDRHRYVDPRVDMVRAGPADAAAYDRALKGCQAAVHLAAAGHDTLASAAARHGVRVVLPVLAGDDSPAEAALTAAGVPLLVVRTAPPAGRRGDADALRTLAGLLRSSEPWQVLHHDDLTRHLVTAATGETTGTLDLAAPGTVSAAQARELLAAAGVRPRLRGVRPRLAAPGLTAGPAGYGWTAVEAVEDLVRALVGRVVKNGETAPVPGRFALPTHVIPINLPPGEGGRLEPAGPPELQGEFDTLLDPRLSVLTATNTSEAMPGPMTPMTLDLQVAAIRISNEDMGQMLALEGEALDQQSSMVMSTLGHCAYINASVGVNVVENMPGWDEASVRRDAYGNIPEDVVFRPEGGPPMPTGLAKRIATLTATTRVINRARRFKEEAERIHTAACRETLDATRVAALDDAQLHARALLWRDRLAHSWCVASIGVMLTSAAGAIHERGKSPEPIGIDVDELESARTMLAVERLAAVLRDRPDLIELARAGRVDELRAASPELARTLDAELAEMGHRGPGECELENPAFATRPEMLVSSAAGAAQQPAPRREPVASPRTRTGRMAVGATLARERGRDGVVRYTHALRLAVSEQGRRLVDRGALADAADVFYLTLDEAYAGPGDLRERVARRREQRARLQAIRMPDVVVGTWQPEVDHEQLAVGGELTGIGVFPGVVEGPVRVLRGPDDDIEPGDVLVASVTDVGHTAMFGYSAAVVTDIGGAASHAAIVAREFGIPCVVDTKHATTSLRDGQRVRVDGATGTVTLLAEAGAPEPTEEETAVG